MEALKLNNIQSFNNSKIGFSALLDELSGKSAQKLDFAGLEELVTVKGREVLRLVVEEALAIRDHGDVGKSVTGADEIPRTHRKTRPRTLQTGLGEVCINRVLYSKPGLDSLAPKDALLNLPPEKYSFPLQKHVVRECIRGSFDSAKTSVHAVLGNSIPKRQEEEILVKAAQDFDDFYLTRSVKNHREINKNSDFLVLSTDGKGIVMRKEGLREATRKRAEANEHKMTTRLSKGEKSNGKRMAQVATVYSIKCHKRTIEDILGKEKTDAPRPESKRIWASLEQDQKTVIKSMFDEASQRDPKQCRSWVILVDGQKAQLEQIKKEVTKRKRKATIILDIVHVIEYLWKAAHEFFKEGTKECEEWVKKNYERVLKNEARQVAIAMKKAASLKGIKSRKNIDTCAKYLTDNIEYTRYQDYIKAGMQIATGVIEGACRHLIKDRMDITGARWGLNCAEAMLKIRSITSSGDFEEYWAFHTAAEYERNHRKLYLNPEIIEKRHLRLVK
jgi:hypothetical protein